MAATSRRRTLEQRLFSEGPKRLLSIDGGGVRTLIACGALAELEERLGRRSGRSDFRLCEYFDLIGGASSGALVAAGLAMGRTAAECGAWLREIAPESGGGRAGPLFAPLHHPERLAAVIESGLGDHELGSGALRCGVAIFVRAAAADAAEAVTNNPRQTGWTSANTDLADAVAPHAPADGLRRIPLGELVRASMGGPGLFDEAGFRLGREERAFANPVLSGLEDPALALLKIATIARHGFGFPAGEDNVLLISVGAGAWRVRAGEGAGGGDAAAKRAVAALSGLLGEARASVLSTLQAMSHPARPMPLRAGRDEEPLSPFPLLTYQRFDAPLEPATLTEFGVDAAARSLEALRSPRAGDPASLDELDMLGRRAAQRIFSSPNEARAAEPRILPPRFDPRFFSEKPPSRPRTRLDALRMTFSPRFEDGD